MPRRNRADTLRVTKIVVGQAVIAGGTPAWTVEEFRECDCPDCEQDGHWFGGATGRGWFESRDEAVAAMERWG